ncbi:MAG: tRNA adenosine(34) deaminase TadA [Microcoleaceae cyanobacterium]
MIIDQYLTHRQWMNEALCLAKKAGEAGEIPVGAVIVNQQGEIIAKGENRREREKDPTAHAEMIALRAAGKFSQNWHLEQCTLYVTLEPCPMCSGAIILARIGLLVYGTSDPKTGSIRTVNNLPDSKTSYHHLPVCAGIMEWECQNLLHDWFSQKRNKSR